VIVNKPPQIHNQSEYQLFTEMIDEFETSTGGAQGSAYTELWLRPYGDYVRASAKFVEAFAFYSDEENEGDDVASQLTYDSVPAFVETIPFMQNFVHYTQTA
jgi:hypothetical protein